MRWFYRQSDGGFGIETSEGRVTLALGYAGKGEGRNAPSLQNVRNVGPLPRGRYLIHEPIRHPSLGPFALKLSPFPSNHMFDRSGFYIHGDNKTNDASRGCIVLSRHIREMVAWSEMRELHVIR